MFDSDAAPKPLLAALGASPAWRHDAACREHPDVSFFPDGNQSAEPALAVCVQCLVRTECLAWALENDERYGIWGGRSEVERRAMRKKASVPPDDDDDLAAALAHLVECWRLPVAQRSLTGDATHDATTGRP